MLARGDVLPTWMGPHSAVLKFFVVASKTRPDKTSLRDDNFAEKMQILTNVREHVSRREGISWFFSHHRCRCRGTRSQ